MMKKLKSTDFLFVIAMALVMMLHIHYISIIPFADDESFYAVVPFRLINGDSLVQHEWHLSQFSSIFSYLPVYIWTAIKGSTESIILFLRYTYLIIHTVTAVAIYAFFRKHGKWAVLAAIIFYIQVAYKIWALSYPTVFAIFLLLLSLCLVSIYQKNSVRFHILAGICFGCCCVCNPIFCFAFPIYFIVCVLWARHETIETRIMEAKLSRSLKKGKKLTKKQKKEQMKQLPKLFPNAESYNCFFGKEAFLRFFCGILIAAIVALVFYFSTGGTIGAIFRNMENLLVSSEYTSQSFLEKLQETIYAFSTVSFGTSWLLPVFFIVLLLDKKRTSNKHRLIYLVVATLWAIIYVLGVFVDDINIIHAYSLPFTVFSVICYFLTENKNKVLFYCMCIPCLIAACFQYFAANTQMASLGVAFAIGNVAGVFFARDLFNEIRSNSKANSEITNKVSSGWQKSIIIIAICIQISFYAMSYQIGQISIKDTTEATTGPYSGLYMNDEQYDEYTKEINDVDAIKALTNKNHPVLLITYNNWLYLHLDRPIATYTTWYRGSFNRELMLYYYKENPQKIPKYIYIESSNPVAARIQMLSEMFEFTKEDLSNGVLLTVEGCKF